MKTTLYNNSNHNIIKIIIYLHMYYQKDKVLQYWKFHKIKLIAIKQIIGRTIHNKETMR